MTTKAKENVTISTKGWNWGYFHMEEKQLKLTHDKEGTKQAFTLPYKDIAISNATKANEVTIEFQQEGDDQQKR